MLIWVDFAECAMKLGVMAACFGGMKIEEALAYCKKVGLHAIVKSLRMFIRSLLARTFSANRPFCVAMSMATRSF